MKILALTYERGYEIEKKHDVMYMDINEIDQIGWDQALNQVIEFNPEIVFEREFNDGKAYYLPLLHTIKTALPKTLRVRWYIDTHIKEQEHFMYGKYIDIHFFAVSRYATKYKKTFGTGNSFWLPLCYPGRSDSIQPNYNEIKHEISFVGNWNEEWYPERTEMVKFLQKEYGKKFNGVRGDYDNMLSILKRSKVGVNYAISGDLNFRVFETLACGTELVTNAVPDMWKIRGLLDRVHCFDSMEEKDKLKMYIDALLENDPVYTHNSLQTQNWIKDKHTMKNRMFEMLDMIEYRKQIEY